jgi:hypothetical protein
MIQETRKICIKIIIDLKWHNHCLKNIGVQIFNHLPKIVKDCISVKAFKTALQGLLIEHCFYTLDEFFNMSFV